MKTLSEYLIERLPPQLLLIPQDEELVCLHLINDEGLGYYELTFLASSIIIQLNMYVGFVTGYYDFKPPHFIPLSEDKEDCRDLLIIIRKSDLRGIEIADESNTDLTDITQYPINHYVRNSSVRKIDLKVIKEYEGTKEDLVDYLLKQLGYLERAYIIYRRNEYEQKKKESTNNFMGVNFTNQSNTYGMRPQYSS